MEDSFRRGSCSTIHHRCQSESKCCCLCLLDERSRSKGIRSDLQCRYQRHSPFCCRSSRDPSFQHWYLRRIRRCDYCSDSSRDSTPFLSWVNPHQFDEHVRSTSYRCRLSDAVSFDLSLLIRLSLMIIPACTVPPTFKFFEKLSNSLEDFRKPLLSQNMSSLNSLLALPSLPMVRASSSVSRKN